MKCVTPSLPENLANLTNKWLPVSVLKKTNNGYDEVKSLGPLEYRYASGATPRLAAVYPQVAGPSDVLRIQAWACGGIIEGTPIELVGVGREKDADQDSASHDIVDDAEKAWGHICEPFPAAISEPDEKQDDCGQDGQQEGGPKCLGEIGLSAARYDFSGRVDEKEFKQLFDKSSIVDADRFVQPVLGLANGHYYQNKQKGFAVSLNGWLKVENEGSYAFRIRCYDMCSIKLNNKAFQQGWQEVPRWPPSCRDGSCRFRAWLESA